MSNGNEVIVYIDETGGRNEEAFRRMWADLEAVVPGTAYTVCFGGRREGKSTYAQTVATIREQLRRDQLHLAPAAPPKDVVYEREQRKQLLKNTRGPRASRWS